MKSTGRLISVPALISLTLGILFILSLPAIPDDTTSAPPDIKGVWKGTVDVYYPEGINRQEIVFTVSEQNGWYFKGVRHRKMIESSGKASSYVKDKAENEADEPVLGVIGFDGRSFNLVEVGDYGMLKGSLVGGNQMELIYLESGDHPLVSRTVLTRE